MYVSKAMNASYSEWKLFDMVWQQEDVGGQRGCALVASPAYASCGAFELGFSGLFFPSHIFPYSIHTISFDSVSTQSSSYRSNPRHLFLRNAVFSCTQPNETCEQTCIVKVE